jgi:hypothetical protein
MVYFIMFVIQVGEFNSVKNLSLGFSGSYEVEPELERVRQLVEWSSGLNDTSISSQLPATQPKWYVNSSDALDIRPDNPFVLYRTVICCIGVYRFLIS